MAIAKPLTRMREIEIEAHIRSAGALEGVELRVIHDLWAALEFWREVVKAASDFDSDNELCNFGCGANLMSGKNLPPEKHFHDCPWLLAQSSTLPK